MMRAILGLAVLVLALAGCTTYHGLRPINPENTDKTTQVRPVFQWEPASESGVKYDLVIYELIRRDRVPTAGEMVYSREGLQQTEHKIETDLTPGKEYLWSVRTRSDTSVGPWSRYDFDGFYIVYSVRQRNLFYQLKVDRAK